MAQPVAIVTGASSGIGLALTQHLLSKGWKVMMADVNPPRDDSIDPRYADHFAFQKTDVSSWDQQAALFKRAFTWGNRLDFLAANAGIDVKQSLYELEPNPEAEPCELNLKCLRVDLDAVFQGVWLFKHYARKNKKPGGKVVITSSMMGIYPFPTNPQYAAAKHGVIGLTRSCGSEFAREGITVNAIMPAFVATGLAPAGLVDMYPEEHLTPMSTIIKAYDTFIGDDSMTGQTVECSLDQLYFRKRPDYPNKSQEWIADDTERFWVKAYKKLDAKK